MIDRSSLLVPLLAGFGLILLLMLALTAMGIVQLLSLGEQVAAAADGAGRIAYTVAGMALLLSVLVAALAIHLARRQERELRLARDRAEFTLNAISDAVIRYDLDGRTCYLNPAARQLLGIEIDAPRDDRAAESFQLFDHRSRQSLLPGLLEQAGGGEPVALPAEARLLTRQGIELEIEGTCRGMHDDQGEVRALVLVLRDVTESREWMRQQLDLWDRDPLTALPGPRYLENRLGKVLLHKRTADLPMAYLRIGVPGIPLLAAQDGVEAGNALVRHIATLLRSRVRDTDLIARMGEQEFGILLTACPPDISARIEAEIRACLETFRFEWAGREHELMADIRGIHTPPFEGSVDEFLAASGQHRP